VRSDLKLFYEPEGRLRLTTADKSYLTVKPVWASPLSHPEKYLSLVDGKDREIVLLESLAELPEAERTIVQEELRRRYLTARVTRIDSVKTEFGVTYWSVQTDRGPRELVTQSLQENANWLAPGHLLVTDVDGNRFEVEVAKLDARSQELVGQTV
jgi:hypothetical protein